MVDQKYFITIGIPFLARFSLLRCRGLRKIYRSNHLIVELEPRLLAGMSWSVRGQMYSWIELHTLHRKPELHNARDKH